MTRSIELPLPRVTFLARSTSTPPAARPFASAKSCWSVICADSAASSVVSCKTNRTATRAKSTVVSAGVNPDPGTGVGAIPPPPPLVLVLVLLLLVIVVVVVVVLVVVRSGNGMVVAKMVEKVAGAGTSV